MTFQGYPIQDRVANKATQSSLSRARKTRQGENHDNRERRVSRKKMSQEVLI